MDCPRCHKDKGSERVEGKSSLFKCAGCKYVFIDNEAEVALGVRKVEITDSLGNKIFAYEGVGDNWKRFPSWYCLKFFDTYDLRISHDRKYHKIGDKMLGMIPSGFITEEMECGND